MNVPAPMTGRQKAVLRLIQRVLRDDPLRRPPSVRDIAEHFGIHHRAVEEHLHALWKKGWLKSPTPDGIYCTHAPR
jgi:DNA-binding MarR family transcriptional regulator